MEEDEPKLKEVVALLFSACIYREKVGERGEEGGEGGESTGRKQSKAPLL